MLGDSRYTAENLGRVVRAPVLLGRELNRLYHQRGGKRTHNPHGTDIFAEEWDNLLILDACRCDMLADRDIPGRLEARISRGSSSTEFLLGNFRGRDLRDTVYVTANAHLQKYRNRIDPELHAEYHVFDEEGWHEDLNTVLPETMNQYALEAHEEHPNKRLIVHYIQPHQPFIGETGRELFDPGPDSPWAKYLEGRAEFTKEQLRQAFEENLDIVLPYVRELLEELPGRTVVTSDHGQMLGERSFPIPFRDYGHPEGVHVRELVQIPWLVHQNGERKETVSEAPARNQNQPTDETVEDRLRDLGYRE